MHSTKPPPSMPALASRPAVQTSQRRNISRPSRPAYSVTARPTTPQRYKPSWAAAIARFTSPRATTSPASSSFRRYRAAARLRSRLPRLGKTGTKRPTHRHGEHKCISAATARRCWVIATRTRQANSDTECSYSQPTIRETGARIASRNFVTGCLTHDATAVLDR